MLKQAEKLPNTSGVYLFLDKNGGVLYVGRAVNLRRRVLGYFRPVLDLRLSEMVKQAVKIKRHKTDNLLEAVILEANLIKKHWPKYNVRDKDNRSFLYLVIPKTDWPAPRIVRGRELKKFPANKAYIFGPYQGLNLLETALKIIRRVFPYSTCKSFAGKPCFHRQIGLCPGLCTGEISKKDYQNNIKNIILLLKGQKKRLLTKLKKENPEKAKALKHLQDVALFKKEDILPEKGVYRIESYDISHLTGKETYGAMVVFENNKPKKADYRLFKIRSAKPGDDLAALSETLKRRLRHSEWRLPDFIIIDGGRPQVEAASQALKERRVNIPLAGISKYGGDKLVFPVKTPSLIKKMAKNLKPVLLKARNEAHRFSQKASRRTRRLKK